MTRKESALGSQVQKGKTNREGNGFRLTGRADRDRGSKRVRLTGRADRDGGIDLGRRSHDSGYNCFNNYL